MRLLELVGFAPLAVAVACGGEAFSLDDAGAGGAGAAAGHAGSSASGSGGGGGALAGGAGTGMGGGPSRNSGDCDTASDCGGDPCVELTPGGYRVCATKVPEATACTAPGQDQCCKTADCLAAGKPGGKCILGPIGPSCGGPIQLPTNVCAKDACTSAANCAGTNAVCVPAGALGRKVASCMTGGCLFDRDCTAEPGGICVPVASPCCSEAVGLFCNYHDGCRSSADCLPDQHCAIAADTGRASCAAGLVACAASL
jgi:hypothetical protein